MDDLARIYRETSGVLFDEEDLALDLGLDLDVVNHFSQTDTDTPDLQLDPESDIE